MEGYRDKIRLDLGL